MAKLLGPCGDYHTTPRGVEAYLLSTRLTFLNKCSKHVEGFGETTSTRFKLLS